MESIILKLQLTVKTVLDNLTDLAFSPVWCLYNIVTQTIEVWRSEVASNEEEEPQQPEHHAIGFHQ